MNGKKGRRLKTGQHSRALSCKFKCCGFRISKQMKKTEENPVMLSRDKGNLRGFVQHLTHPAKVSGIM